MMRNLLKFCFLGFVVLGIGSSAKANVWGQQDVGCKIPFDGPGLIRKWEDITVNIFTRGGQYAWVDCLVLPRHYQFVASSPTKMQFQANRLADGWRMVLEPGLAPLVVKDCQNQKDCKIITHSYTVKFSAYRAKTGHELMDYLRLVAAAVVQNMNHVVSKDIKQGDKVEESVNLTYSFEGDNQAPIVWTVNVLEVPDL